MKPVDEIKVGDVTASPITNAHGAVLIGADVALDERHLRLLRMWGIDRVAVRGDKGDKDESDVAREAALAAAEEAVKARFGPSLNNVVMAEILRAAVESIAAAEANGKTP